MPGFKYPWMWKEITEIRYVSYRCLYTRNIITKYIARTHTHAVSFSLQIPNKTCFIRAFPSLIFLNDKRKGTLAPSGRFFFRCLPHAHLQYVCMPYAHKRIHVCHKALTWKILLRKNLWMHSVICNVCVLYLFIYKSMNRENKINQINSSFRQADQILI